MVLSNDGKRVSAIERVVKLSDIAAMIVSDRNLIGYFRRVGLFITLQNGADWSQDFQDWNHYDKRYESPHSRFRERRYQRPQHPNYLV